MLREVDYRLPQVVVPETVETITPVETQEKPEIVEAKTTQVVQGESEQPQKEEPPKEEKVSAIRERLMKKKLEKLQAKEEEKAAVQTAAAEKVVPPPTQGQQIQLMTKQEALKIQLQQEHEQKIAQMYDYPLSSELQTLLTDKVEQHYLKRRLLFKALMSMKHLLNREWQKISVYNVIYDIFLNKRGVFIEEEQVKLDDFMSELQSIKASDSKKLTQNVMNESKIIQNATNSLNDVRKMTMGTSQAAGDGQSSWVARQMGI